MTHSSPRRPIALKPGWILAAIVLAHLLLLGALAAGHTASMPVAITPPTVMGRLVSTPHPRPAPAPPRRTAPPIAPHHDARPLPARPAATAATRASRPGSSAAPAPATTAAPASAAPPAPSPKDEAAPTPPRIDASGLDNPAPLYPAASRRLGEQGQVLLDVHILADGRVGEARLRRSSGFDRLDTAALAAVRRWHYRPAHRGDEAIAFWYVQPIAFTLDP
ncbi:energy transducer TonB [Paludibacterium yongneupense]|uniref:energy transducer TonB n=1 Tax=Paludibacterium yongneupense TaxID=400061 RepID=UPI0004039EA5|nr:energy transducer TonB [Paludibacterium yongneupense]